MKKLISLLLCCVVICSTFAQRNDRDRRYNDYQVYQNNNNRYNERARTIRRINDEYNFKINQVNNNWTLSRGQKRRTVKMLEKQRAFEIRQANARRNDYGYNNRSNGSYNRNYDRSRNNRYDNDRDD
jgi:hypothetical protein